MRADENGRHSLCDFGIAGVLETGEDQEPKLTQSGEILGHPAYISPEQMEGKPLTDRADIYSLGILGHQLLTGHPPPPGDEASQGPGRAGPSVGLEPLADFLRDTDPELAEIISSCLATDPAHRPSADDVERKLTGDRRSSAQKRVDELVEVNVGKLILKKRLPQMLGAYIAGAWLSVEAAMAFNGWRPTAWLIPLVVTSLPFGFVAVSILGWFHGERGRQSVPTVEKWLLWTLLVGWVGAGIWVVFRY